MSIQNAIQFIKAYRHDEKLRHYLGILKTPGERRAFISEIDMPFYDEEFEEACNLLLLRCSDEADHNVLLQLKISYIELMASL
jgi:hypothetical protein